MTAAPTRVLKPDQLFHAMGFQEDPFKITPDIDYLYAGSQHPEVVSQLQYAAYGGSLSILTGEVGLGKTLICRKLLHDFAERDDIRTAYLLNPPQNFSHLLAAVIQDLTGARTRARTQHYQQFVELLHQVLCAEAEQGRQVLIIVDEAHRLDPEVLEGIRLLTNLETSKQKLVSVLLVGQPELEETLKKRELRQFNQRIGVRCRLRSLNREQTNEYVQHRLGHDAEQRPPMTFNSWALWWLYHYSHGIPRRINLISSRALVAAFANFSSRVTAVHVRKSAREIDGLLG